MLTQEQKRLLGLDIGSRAVKLVELSGEAPEFVLESIGLAVVDDPDSPEAYESAVSSVLETAGVESKRVATSVRGSHVAVRSFWFPKLSPAELEGAAWYEGSQVIAFDIDDAYVDHTVLGSSKDEGEKTEVLFVAVRKDDVDFKTRLIEKVNLEPRLVSVDAIALLEALLLEEDLPETVAVIDVGASNSSIGITKRGSAPFVRDIEIAGDSFTVAIAAAVGISMAEAERAKLEESCERHSVARALSTATYRLVGEVRRSLVYYQTREHGSNVEAIFICGGCSRLPGLSESIAEATGVPVHRWSPFDRVRIDDRRFDRATVDDLAPSMAVAAALAMQKDVS